MVNSSVHMYVCPFPHLGHPAWSLRPEAWMAVWASALAGGPRGGNVRISTFNRTLSPIGAAALLPDGISRPIKAGQGNCWPFDAFGRLVKAVNLAGRSLAIIPDPSVSSLLLFILLLSLILCHPGCIIVHPELLGARYRGRISWNNATIIFPPACYECNGWRSNQRLKAFCLHVKVGAWMSICVYFNPLVQQHQHFRKSKDKWEECN